MGLQVETTVWAPAAPPSPNPNNAGAYDLTTLAVGKDELDIAANDTTKDVRLARYITAVSGAICSYCNHVFAIEGVTDLNFLDQDPYPYQTPAGVRPLQLSRWPLVGVQTLKTTADAGAGATVLPMASPPSAPLAGQQSQQPVSGLNIAAGTLVGSVSGNDVALSAPIAAEIPAGTPVTFGLAVAQTLALGTLQALVLGTDYAIDPDRGQLSRLNPFTGVTVPWEALPTSVSYYAGYTSVPPDVEMACLRLVTMRYWEHGRDPSLREREQPTRGREVFWIGGPPKSGSLPEEVAGLLDKYRVPVAF